jgi:hypothetical protein
MKQEGPEPIRHHVLKPDQALAPLVGLGLVAHAAEREGGADGLVGGLRDGDPDRPARQLFFWLRERRKRKDDQTMRRLQQLN